MSEELIILESIKKVFYTEAIETHALTEIHLTIRNGEYVSISGASGCGKSTLLSLIGLLDHPTFGSYRLNGKDVTSLSNGEKARIRNQNIGFIFQSFNLISDLSVRENIELPLTYRSKMDKDKRKKLVTSALEKVNMLHRENHFPSQLSGGQQQRVAIARAIVGNPSIILADEPTGNLDTKNATAVMEILESLHDEGSTICMVTHDTDLVKRTERNIEMLDGKIVSDKSNLDLSIISNAGKEMQI